MPRLSASCAQDMRTMNTFFQCPRLELFGPPRTSHIPISCLARLSGRQYDETGLEGQCNREGCLQSSGQSDCTAVRPFLGVEGIINDTEAIINPGFGRV